MIRLRTDRFTLPVQMVASLIALVCLTAAAVGLPSIWLIRSQLERQAWALIDQGSGAAQALYTAQQSQVDNLALLIAQRTTLIQLLKQGIPSELNAYLHTLQTGAGLDVVVICGSDGQPVAQSGRQIQPAVCTDFTSPHLEPAASQASPLAWLLASEPILDSSGRPTGWQVIAGQALDDNFLLQVRKESGLEQILLAGGKLAATSFSDPAEAWAAISRAAPNGVVPQVFGQDTAPSDPLQHSRFSLGGAPYFAARFILGGSLENIVSLPVTDILHTQGQITRAIGAGILVVAAIGSVLGVLLARRVSRPLTRLGAAAVGIRNGDLNTPVSTYSRLPEVVLVANAMEDARVALLHTITELRQEKDWVDHLLGSIVEGILTLDQYNRITYFSRGAEQISGWKQEQVIRRSIDEIFHPAEERSPFSQLLPTAGGRRKITVALRDGSQKTLSVTGASLAPPEAVKARVVLVLRDVSDEEAIRRLLGDFLANISHEFRTPLAALDASIELLLDQLPDLSQGEVRELLSSLHLGILSLQTLIDNLLEGASIETGHFRVYPRPADPVEILKSAAEVMQPLLEKYGQRLAVELPDRLPQVLADPRRTGQVLMNLLSNAIKHSPPGIEILLSARAEAGRLQVMVCDRGPGIPPEQQADLFHRFAHFDQDGGRAESGAGLGLSVVKAIVEAQGGQVGVSDRPGGGAIFWFTLPLEDSDPLTTKGTKDTKVHEEII